MPDGNEGGWGRVPRWISEHPDAQHVDVRIYGWLAWAASPGRTYRAPAAYIGAQLAGIHPATVRRALTRLERIGAVTLRRSGGRPPLITIHRTPLDLFERRLPQGRFDFPSP